MTMQSPLRTPLQSPMQTPCDPPPSTIPHTPYAPARPFRGGAQRISGLTGSASGTIVANQETGWSEDVP
jgi:hypothetical protein